MGREVGAELGRLLAGTAGASRKRQGRLSHLPAFGAPLTHAVRVRIVRSGRWLYDGSAPMPVDIVALDFDF